MATIGTVNHEIISKIREKNSKLTLEERLQKVNDAFEQLGKIKIDHSIAEQELSYIRDQLAESIVDDFGDNINLIITPSKDEYAEIRIEALKAEVLDYLQLEIVAADEIGEEDYYINWFNRIKISVEKIFEKY